MAKKPKGETPSNYLSDQIVALIEDRPVSTEHTTRLETTLEAARVLGCSDTEALVMAEALLSHRKQEGF